MMRSLLANRSVRPYLLVVVIAVVLDSRRPWPVLHDLDGV